MVNPASFIICRVCLLDAPRVFRYPSTKSEFAGYSAITSILRRCTSLPAAIRISAFGFRKRYKHNTRRQYSGLRFGVSESTFPGIGIRKLTGIDWTSSSRRVLATSMTSFSTSPIPTMIPAHSSILALCAACNVSSRS